MCVFLCVSVCDRFSSSPPSLLPFKPLAPTWLKAKTHYHTCGRRGVHAAESHKDYYFRHFSAGSLFLLLLSVHFSHPLLFSCPPILPTLPEPPTASPFKATVEF